MNCNSTRMLNARKIAGLLGIRIACHGLLRSTHGVVSTLICSVTKILRMKTEDHTISTTVNVGISIKLGLSLSSMFTLMWISMIKTLKWKQVRRYSQ